MGIIYNYTSKEIYDISLKIPCDGIFIIDNFFSDNLCDIIRNEIENKAKIDETVFIPGTNVKCKKIPMEQAIELPFHSKVLERLNAFGRKMNREYSINNTAIEPIGYRKIYGNTRIHADGVSNTISSSGKRSLSIIIGLNEDYEGGEIVFPTQDRQIKLKRGQAIAFPPFWTHHHYTNDLKNNTFRYTLNTWFYHN